MSISEKYKICNKLGHQKVRKFGEIYLVENKTTGERAVLKTVRKTSKNQHIVERLKHEAKFTFEFDGLPIILEQFESENELIILRKYIEGIRLNQYWASLKRKDKLPFLVELIHKLQRIFEHLKENGIVHCDIKSSNILITDDGDVELIDFGLALNLNNPDKRNILFPLGFAAPELLLNRLHLVTQATDIYALGVLIWSLFTGNLPLTHPNPSIFTNLQLTHALPDHSALPKGLYSVLSKMTAKHQFKLPPNKMKQEDVDALLQQAITLRYQNLTECKEDLEKIKSRKSFYQRMSFLNPKLKLKNKGL